MHVTDSCLWLIAGDIRVQHAYIVKECNLLCVCAFFGRANVIYLYGHYGKLMKTWKLFLV